MGEHPLPEMRDSMLREWIAFCDPDDQFDGKYLQNLYDGVKEGAELVIGGFTKLFNISKKEYEHDFSIHLQNGQNQNTYNIKEALQVINFINMVVLWNKLYNRNIIEHFHLRFDEKAFCGEDVIFNLDFYKHISIISLILNCGYCYLIRDNSSLTSTYKKNFQYARWQQMIKENELLDIFECDEQKKKEKEIKNFFNYHLFVVHNIFQKNTPYNFREAKEEIEKSIFTDNETRRKLIQHQPHGLLEKSFYYSVKINSPFFVALSMKVWQTLVHFQSLRAILKR